MRDFKFQGDWETEMTLDHLTLLQEDRFFDGLYSAKSKEKLVQGLVDLKIWDSYDNNPDPTKEQLMTIRFIQENEIKLLDLIFERVKNNIYPHMKTLIDDEVWWFPPIESSTDLKKVFGLVSIDIFQAQRDGHSYFSINFHCSWDIEHGCHILFHKDRILDTGEAWGVDTKKICLDCGVEYEKTVHDFNHWSDAIFEFIEPNSKYGKLKPNQINANETLPYRIIRNGMKDKLLKYISDGVIDLNYNMHGHSLLAAALQAENLAIVQFLIKNKVKCFNNVEYALSRVHNEEIKRIVEKYYTETLKTSKVGHEHQTEVEKNSPWERLKKYFK